MRSEIEDAYMEENDMEPVTQGTGAGRNVMSRLLSKLLQVNRTSSPPPLPMTIHMPEPAGARGGCMSCGCCAVLLAFVFLLAGLAMFITAYALWTPVIAASTELTGWTTRLLGLQGHYTFTGFMGTGGAALTQETVGTSSTAPQAAVVHGWFDLHAQRTDWNVVLFQDTFGLFLAPNPSGRFYLWAKQFNETTHTLEHAPGSPWLLNSTRTGSRSSGDLPVFVRQGGSGSAEPLFYWFVIQSSQTTWSIPLRASGAP